MSNYQELPSVLLWGGKLLTRLSILPQKLCSRRFSCLPILTPAASPSSVHAMSAPIYSMSQVTIC